MVQRISGLASGMDIDSIVSKMIQAKRAPIDKQIQKRQLLQWQRESLRDMNTKMLDFRNNKMGNNYRMATTYSATKVTVTGDTNAVSAKANGIVTGTNMSVKVDQLGTAALDSMNVADLNVSKDGEQWIVPTGSTLVINGYTVESGLSETLNSFLSRVSKDTNVSAFYDEKLGKISFSAKNTGKIDKVEKDADGKYVKTGSLDNIEFGGTLLTNPSKTSYNAIVGKESKVTINGMAYTPDSNIFTLNGVEFTLLKESTSTSSITMTPDTDKIVDTVKAFVADYNEMLSTLNGLINEKRYRDYSPLTDEQKKDMKDTQIEQWEKKAKSGLLYSDFTLSAATRSMRYAVMTEFNFGNDSKYKTLSSIGITTGSYQENGKLYVDEAKLRKALEAEPDVVKNMFSSKGTPDELDTDGQPIKPQKPDWQRNFGVAEQLYRSFNTAQKDIMKKIGYASIEDSSAKDESIIGKQIYNLSKEIKAGENRMKDLETRYYKQFSAMETAINKANSQSAALSRSFG